MNKLICFACFGLALIGCASTPKLISTRVREGNHSLKLLSIKDANIALLPLRSTLGEQVKNKTVESRLTQHISQGFSQINLIRPGELGKLMYRKTSETNSGYRELLRKYFAAGRLSRQGLNLFKSVDIDYVISVSLNSGFQNYSYPKTYLFLLSMQIWDVKTGQIVWDIDQEGEVWIETEAEDRTNRILLMQNICDEVLARLS
jgi:hypothetical protein